MSPSTSLWVWGEHVCEMGWGVCTCNEEAVLSRLLFPGQALPTLLWQTLPKSNRSARRWQSQETTPSVQLLSHVRLFATLWIAACQASLSIANSRSLPKLKSIESVMPSNHLILCCPHLLLPSIFPSIRVFSNESLLHIRWPKYWRLQH